MNIMQPTSKKILIIEDDIFIADVYARELTKEGFQVKTANDGMVGLQDLEKDQYDLLLLDIMLPSIHGLEILRQWKTKHANSNMPILLLTNIGQDEVIKESFALGAQGYLIKASYTPKQVVEEVKSVLGGRGASNPPPAPTPVS